MKRIICAVLICSLLLCGMPVNCFAEEIKECVVDVFEDGSYLTDELIVVQYRVNNTKSGTRIRNYYTSDGTLEWKAVLSGTFTYTGTTSTCTSSSCNVTIYNSDWYTVSKSASKSGNTATASVTMGKKLLGVTVATIPVSLTLTCDNNGNLS